jgi:hypothetical protein
MLLPFLFWGLTGEYPGFIVTHFCLIFKQLVDVVYVPEQDPGGGPAGVFARLEL